MRIVIPPTERWNEETEEFEHFTGVTLRLEHSLRAIRLWESKWHKPFLADEKHTYAETLDYIRCMTYEPEDPDPYIFTYLTDENINEIVAYIDNPATATTINSIQKHGGVKKKEVLTAEVIYYMMIAQNIPVEFERWHLNQLLTLIEVCSIKNDPNPKKMKGRELADYNRQLNAARRAKLKSKG